MNRFFLSVRVTEGYKGDDPGTMTYEEFQKIVDKKFSKVPLTLNSLLVVLVKYIGGLIPTPSQQQQQYHSQGSLQSNTSDKNTPTVCSGQYNNNNNNNNNASSASSASPSLGTVQEAGETSEKKRKSFFFKKKKTFSTPGPIPPISSEVLAGPDSSGWTENGSPRPLASSFTSSIAAPPLSKKREKHSRDVHDAANVTHNNNNNNNNNNSEETDSPSAGPSCEDFSDNEDDKKKHRSSLKIVIKPKEQEATPGLRASSSLSSVSFMKPPLSSSSRMRIVYNTSSSSLKEQSEVSTREREKSEKSDNSSKGKQGNCCDHEPEVRDRAGEVNEAQTDMDREREAREKEPEQKKENEPKKKRSDKQRKHKKSSHAKKGSSGQKVEFDKSKPLPTAPLQMQQEEEIHSPQGPLFEAAQSHQTTTTTTTAPHKSHPGTPVKSKQKERSTLTSSSTIAATAQTKPEQKNDNSFKLGAKPPVLDPFEAFSNTPITTTTDNNKQKKDSFIDDFFFEATGGKEEAAAAAAAQTNALILAPQPAVHSDPGPDATFRFGMCMKNLESGNYKRGLEDAHKALEMLPDNVEPRYVHLVMSYLVTLLILERLTHQRPLPHETVAWLGTWLASLPMHREHKETCMLIATLYSDSAARAAGSLIPECSELSDMCQPPNDLTSPTVCRNCGSCCDASLPRCFVCGTPVLFCCVSLAPITDREYKVCEFCAATFSKAALITTDDCPLCGRSKRLHYAYKEQQRQ